MKCCDSLIEIQYVEMRWILSVVPSGSGGRGGDFPVANSESAIRVEFFGDEIDRISEIDVVTGEIIGTRNHVVIFPASHYVTSPEKMQLAIHVLKRNWKKVERIEARGQASGSPEVGTADEL